MRLFTIYVNIEENVSKALMEVLGFYEYGNFYIRENTNSAIVNDILKALTDIKYPWSVAYDYSNVFAEGTKRINTFEEWTAFYEG